MFRHKRSIPVGYREQGYIYFTSQQYREMNPEKRKVIRDLCREAGGSYQKAVLEAVTTGAEMKYVCEKHHISVSTLERAVRRYYTAFADRIQDFL